MLFCVAVTLWPGSDRLIRRYHLFGQVSQVIKRVLFITYRKNECTMCVFLTGAPQEQVHPVRAPGSVFKVNQKQVKSCKCAPFLHIVFLHSQFCWMYCLCARCGCT